MELELNAQIDEIRIYGQNSTRRYKFFRILDELNRLLIKTPIQTSINEASVQAEREISTPSISGVTTILFLAANPRDWESLKIRNEIKAIDDELQRSRYRDEFKFVSWQAVRASELRVLFLKHKPRIVQFSGHGNSASEIVLEDGNGKGKPVPPEALSELFGLFKDTIRCVVLNTCYSEVQAKAIAEHIDIVVGMAGQVEDEAAIRFSSSFFGTLGFGESVQSAFNGATVELHLDGLRELINPVILTRVNTSTVKFVNTDSQDL